MSQSPSGGKKAGFAAIFMTDEGPAGSVLPAAVAALDHTVFLVSLWTAAVVSRQLIAGRKLMVLGHARRVAMFAAAYFFIDVAVALRWPDMTENLVQAGLFHIATVMFSCLPETTPD